MNIFSNYLILSIFLVFLSCQTTSTSEKNKPIKQENKVSSVEQAKKNTPNKTIVFFGNSLTAAYGLDATQGFAGLIQKRIDSLNLNYKVVNAGLSGETTSGGNSRIDWILQQKIDIFILELGGNDGLRGISPDVSYKNLNSIINKVKEKYPSAKLILAGMEAPPNMGADFTKEFREMYPKLAKEHEISLIPFLLDGVGGIPELNQADGIHPTAEGHKIVAENIWNILEDLL